VEYFIKDAFEKLGLSEYKEFIHFGLTSQDITLGDLIEKAHNEKRTKTPTTSSR
jgi:hypothetical protein